MTGGLLLQHVQLPGGARCDVRISHARIDAIARDGQLAPTDEEQALDLSGCLLLPAPAEPHAHLDKAYTAERFAATPGDLGEAIVAWEAHRRTLEPADIAQRARRALRSYVARGATAVRTHVDVGEGIGLRATEALIQVRDELADTVTVQVAALSFPLTGRLGADNVARLREALECGVDVVGGAPHVDENPRRHIELCLELAAEYGRPVDLHMDEHLDPDRLDLLDLAAISSGFAQRITASHAVSLGLQPQERQREIAAALAAANIDVVTLPLTNLYLQGRDRLTATPRGLTAVRALLDAGVTVAGGGDNVQDPFNEIGSGDPLETAQLLVAAAHLDCATAYELVSGGARTILGLPKGAVAPGAPADLVAVKAASLREAVAVRSEQRVVIRAGRVLARTRVEREYARDGWPAAPRPQARQESR